MPNRRPRSSNNAGPAALVAAAFGAIARATPARAAAESAQEIARRVLADPRYQKMLPTRDTPHDIHGIHLQSGPLAELLTWLGAALGVILLALWITDLVQRRGSADADGGAAAPAGAPGGHARVSLAQADALAGAGRYTEAVHALLFVALQHVAAQAGVHATPARTSREIVRDLPRAIARDRGPALGELVRHVEISVFGGRELGAEDYQRCVGFCRAALGEGT